jgi:hypothetical protein
VENFERYKSFIRNFDPRQVDMKAFDAYSAREVTAALAGLLDKL